MVNVPNIKLNSGFDMPQIGFGLWKVDDNCADVVYEAIKAGYRLLDGACDYGNEKACGEGVARAIKDGIVKREELFIVSKLWQTYHDKENVEPITRKQLADWQIDYFDLFLIHFPVALEYVDPKAEGIALTAYSSFGPAGFMELDMDIAKSASPLMQHEVFTGLASKYNKTAAQVLLRWATQQGLAVIPKSTTPEYMAQNFGCVGWDIDEEDMKRIARMNLNLKFNKPTNYFPTEKLWIFA
ncbi:putative D-xylose reductase [Fusarium fujikuroi]|nr:putative D-xylose reductase [Fusarium fujikuroi]